MNRDPFRLVVFDMAGTTVEDDHIVAKAFQEAFRPSGIELLEEDIIPLMGYKKSKVIQNVLNAHHLRHDPAEAERIHEYFVQEMIDYYMYSPEVRALPGTEELFEDLKVRGKYVTIDTGFPRDIADVILNRFQWLERGLVDEFIASDEVPEGRPAPYMIRQLMDRLGVQDPALVVKIGDTEVDIREGRNADCGLVVSVTTGAFTREQLLACEPDHIVDHLSEISPLIA